MPLNMKIVTTALIPFYLFRGSVDTVQATVKCDDQNLLRIAFLAGGDIERLNIPVSCSPRRADRLWQHTCFEVFIRAEGDPSYYEFNFSPSGEWAAYWFRSYRDGGITDESGLAPEIVVRRTTARIELDAIVRLARLSAIRPGSLLRIGLAAVIEAGDGTLSYWALKHAAAKPDFHHADSFALELPFPSQSV